MTRLIDSLDAAGVPLADFIAVLASRSPEHNLMGLRAIVDDEQLVEFVDRFRGHYLRSPGETALLSAFYDTIILARVRTLQRAVRLGSLADVHEAQVLLDRTWKAAVKERLIKHPKGAPWQTPEERAALVEAELKISRAWVKSHEGRTAVSLPDLDTPVPEPEGAVVVAPVAKVAAPATLAAPKQCAAVSEAEQQKRRARREARRAAGICRACPALAAPDRTYCAPCLEKVARVAREKRAAKHAKAAHP